MSYEDCSPVAMKDLVSKMLTTHQSYINWNATYNLCMKDSNVDCSPLKKEADRQLDWSQYLQERQTKCILWNKYSGGSSEQN